MRILFGLMLAASVSMPALAGCPPLLDHTFPSLTDQATPLCQFEGKVLLVVNTGERPHWNFHKYLIDRSGEKVLSFGSDVTPGDGRLVGEIERMLAAAERQP